MGFSGKKVENWAGSYFFNTPYTFFAKVISGQNPNIHPTVSKVLKFIPPDQQAEFLRADHYAEDFFRGIKRLSGLLYITHPRGATQILTKRSLYDPQLLIAELFHDILEEVEKGLGVEAAKEKAQEIEYLFGPNVRFLVEGMTKLGKQVENYGLGSIIKLLEYGLMDVRLFLLKLADNEENMRDQKVFAPFKQAEHARETLEIYSPIGRALGVWEWMTILEGYAWRWLNPEIFLQEHEIYRKSLHAGHKKVIGFLNYLAELFGGNFKGKIQMRHKNVSEIYFPLRGEAFRKGIPLEEILPANKGIVEQKLRDTPFYYFNVIITPEDIDGCYRALSVLSKKGLISTAYYSDYLAVTKSDGYKALNVKANIPNEGKILLMITPEDQDGINRLGVISTYHQTGGQPDWHKKVESTWLGNLLKIVKSMPGGTENTIRNEIVKISSSITLSTPKGYKILLPTVCTFLDFVFALHKKFPKFNFPLYADYVWVNGRKRFLHEDLSEYDREAVVHIEKSKRRTLKPSWLSDVYTQEAKDEIRRRLSCLSKEEQIKLGVEAIEEYGAPYYASWEAVKRATFMPHFVETLKKGAIKRSDIKRAFQEVEFTDDDFNSFLGKMFINPKEELLMFAQGKNKWEETIRKHIKGKEEEKERSLQLFLLSLLRHPQKEPVFAKIHTADDLVFYMGKGELDPKLVGDRYNAFYSYVLRTRTNQAKTRYYFIEMKVARDRPGIINLLAGKLSNPVTKFKINIHEQHYVCHPGGSGTFSLILSILSSVQQHQVGRIVSKFLEEIGGGSICREFLGKPGGFFSLKDFDEKRIMP